MKYGKTMHNEAYRGRQMVVWVSPTGFDVDLDGWTRLRGFETVEEALEVTKGFIDSVIAYRERRQNQIGGD